MSVYSVRKGVSIVNDKIRSWYLGRHMDRLADINAKMCQGRKNWYTGRVGNPMDYSSGEECESVIVFECLYLSISQGVYVSRLACVSNKVLRGWVAQKSSDLVHY